MIETNLGAGTMPDVTWTPDGWLYAWQPIGAEYVQLSTGLRLLCGAGQLAFARVAYTPEYGPIVIWRGAGNHVYVLRGAEITDFGPCGGNSPVAVDRGVLAWQTLDATRRKAYSFLELPGAARWLPTGLATANPLTYVDDVRMSVVGMTNPVTAGALTVGESTTRGGALGRLDDGRELLIWPDQDTQTPRCATTLDGTRLAVVTWGREGVRIATDLRPEEFGMLTTPVAPPAPGTPPLEAPRVEGPGGSEGVAYTVEMRKGKEWSCRALFTAPVIEVRVTIGADENLTVLGRNTAGTGSTGKRRPIIGRC